MENNNKMIKNISKRLFALHFSLSTQRGFIALITVLVVSAIAIIVATTTIFLGLSESLLGFSADRSHEALQIADSCAEEAYFRLKKDIDYSGGTLILGNGSCDISISGSGGSGSARAIVSSSTISTGIANFTRRITPDISLLTNADGNATTTDLTRWAE